MLFHFLDCDLVLYRQHTGSDGKALYDVLRSPGIWGSSTGPGFAGEPSNRDRLRFLESFGCDESLLEAPCVPRPTGEAEQLIREHPAEVREAAKNLAEAWGAAGREVLRTDDEPARSEFWNAVSERVLEH